MTEIDVGDLIVRWTVRLAVACLMAFWLMAVADRPGPTVRRVVYTGGWALYVAHVIAAFHIVHRWSHAAAWDAVAAQTVAATGVATGVGLWVNHAVTAVWTVDVIVRWTLRDRPSTWRRRLWTVGVQVFLIFVTAQATVVFGPWGWWPVAAAYLAIGAACVVRRVRPGPGHDRRAD